MSEINELVSQFPEKHRKFTELCNSAEFAHLWDRAKYGEMDVYYDNILLGLILRLIASDEITQSEVDYLNKTFSLSYSLKTLSAIYDDCRDFVGEEYNEEFRAEIKKLEEIDELLALRFKELLLTAGLILTQSDGKVTSAETDILAQIREICG